MTRFRVISPDRGGRTYQLFVDDLCRYRAAMVEGLTHINDSLGKPLTSKRDFVSEIGVPHTVSTLRQSRTNLVI